MSQSGSGGGSAQPKPAQTPTPQGTQPTPTPVSPNSSQPTPEPLKPDIIQDGMEGYTDVNHCLRRAAELSQKAGFTADISRTINMGFYKVSPAQGLCDIHFMKDFSIEIASHEGKDSVLDRQIALYCPCAGNWAKTHTD